MQALKNLSAGVLLCTLTGAAFSQQILLTKEWSTNAGTQNMFRKSRSRTDAAGNVYIIGETVNGNGNYDWLIEKYTATGSLDWNSQVNGAADMDDFIADIFIDASGNVYVVGAVVQNASDSLDICVRKYTSAGSVSWTEYYNGADNRSDVGTSIYVDGSGNVYITGTEGTHADMQDCITRKYNSSGSLLWTQRYDYAGFHDAGAFVQISPGLSNVLIVTAGSQGSALSWDVATILYNATTGALFGSSRISGGTGTFYEVSDAVLDPSGNLYIVGSYATMLGDVDIKVIKVNSNYTLAWEETYSGPVSGGEDKGNAVRVDGSGNVYVTGYVTRLDEGKNVILLKYNSSGTLQYDTEYNGVLGDDDVGNMLALDNDKPIITGYTTRSLTGKDYLTIGFDANGFVKWKKIHAGTANFEDDVATDIAIDGEKNIIITGQITTGATFHYSTLSYSILERSDSILFDTAGYPKMAIGSLIVNFNPGIINTSFIDDREKRFGRPQDIIDTAVVSAMSAKLGFDVTKHAHLAKIYPKFLTADTFSVTRLGDTIIIPKFWCSLLMLLPDTTDLYKASDSLVSIIGQVHYAELDYVAENQSSDPLWSVQQNCKSSTYPNAHINIEPFWAEESGNSFVKVGVYDVGIHWSHPDFSTDGSNSIESSVIEFGYDYYGDFEMTSNLGFVSFDFDNASHGTRCAGIIGALKDNNVGIAGIAGGNGGSDDGCRMYAMKLANNDYYLTSIVIRAVIEGAIVIPGQGPGLGLHISNHSYGFSEDMNHPVDSIKELAKAYYWAWRNGVTQVASRGNYQGQSFGVNGNKYPACFHDDWIITVGANGTDGNRMVGASNGDPSESYESMTEKVDCIAPGTIALVQETTHKDPSNPYQSFNGTSAAAPHVVGVAALMMSYYNDPNGSNFNNLIADDIEFLIQKYADDRDIPGFDNNTGWGMLNAGNIIDHIKKPRYDILHYVGNNPMSSSTTLIDDDLHIYLDDDFNGFGKGWYTAEVYEVQSTFSYTLPVGTSIVNAWPLRSHSVGLPYAILPYPHRPTWSDIVSVTSSQIVLKTYVYKAIHQWSGNQPMNQWIGMNAAATKLPFALHIDYGVEVGTEAVEKSDIKVFPNPTYDFVQIVLPADNLQGEIQVYDIAGKLLDVMMLSSTFHKYDLSRYSAGTYFINIKYEETSKVYKIIKQ